MQTLELEDIQGIIVRGYGSLNDTSFSMLGIEDVASAKRWLAALASEVRDGQARPYDPVVNVAFTYPGLHRLGLDEHVLVQFAREFCEGMVAEHRSRILGDHGNSAPDNWLWGGPKNEEIHILLMLYARDRAQLDEYYAPHAERFKSHGLVEIRRLHALTLKGRKEHFGFRDGIGQPIIEGLNKPGAPSNRVKAGEFILGYANEYGQYPESPLIETGEDTAGLLRNAASAPGLRDFGRNGNYLAFPQMRQYVHHFWRFLDEAAKNPDGSSNAERRVMLAAKMVGRWPSGAPLINSPDRDRPELLDDDRFLYHHTDPYGYKTPIGAHIRRTNPLEVI
jgi:deferrochelatase/peroxidase EfeB